MTDFLNNSDGSIKDIFAASTNPTQGQTNQQFVLHSKKALCNGKQTSQINQKAKIGEYFYRNQYSGAIRTNSGFSIDQNLCDAKDTKIEKAEQLSVLKKYMRELDKDQYKIPTRAYSPSRKGLNKNEQNINIKKFNQTGEVKNLGYRAIFSTHLNKSELLKNNHK